MQALGEYETSTLFTPLEKLLLRYADCMTQTPVEVPDALFDELKAHFTEAELVELTATIAWENYRARFDHAFGIGAEGFSEPSYCALPANGGQPGYFVAEVEVTDPATYQRYMEKLPETLAPFHSRYLARGGKVDALEGETAKRIVMIAFDSAEKAREWYGSPAYEAIKPLRLSSAKSRVFITEGVAQH